MQVFLVLERNTSHIHIVDTGGDEMDDIKKARDRIKHRRFDGEEKNHRPFLLFRLFFHTIMLMMGVCVVALVLLLNQKLQLIEINSVLKYMPIENISNWLPFENWFSYDSVPVSNAPMYTLLKDDQYTNGTNQAKSGYTGIVLHVQQETDGTYLLHMKQDNGVVVSYGNLQEVIVKEEERVVKDAVFGSYENYITISALRDSKPESIENAFS